MPDFESHLRQAERNERVASHLATFPDWQTVALFYAALHYVDAYLAQRFGAQGHPTSHQARLRFLARDPALGHQKTPSPPEKAYAYESVM